MAVNLDNLLMLDFADLELRVYANCIKENKRASRMPARKLKYLWNSIK